MSEIVQNDKRLERLAASVSALASAVTAHSDALMSMMEENRQGAIDAVRKSLAEVREADQRLKAALKVTEGDTK